MSANEDKAAAYDHITGYTLQEAWDALPEGIKGAVLDIIKDYQAEQSILDDILPLARLTGVWMQVYESHRFMGPPDYDVEEMPLEDAAPHIARWRKAEDDMAAQHEASW